MKLVASVYRSATMLHHNVIYEKLIIERN